MTNIDSNTQASGFGFNHIGWRYYKEIKKKAMEQEFSWSGLLISLSIAFFIVITVSFVLSLTYQSLAKDGFSQNKNIYQLEVFNSDKYLDSDFVKKIKKNEYLKLA